MTRKLRNVTPPSGTPPLLPIPLPTSSPPLLLPSTDCRAGDSEVTLPPQKRLCIALGLRYEAGESSSAPTSRPSRGFRANYGFVATLDDEIRRDPKRDVGYGITDTWDEMLVGMPGAPSNNDTELGRRMTNFVTTVRQDTDEIYGRLDEVRALWTTLLAQQTEIAGLRVADRTRQAQLVETLTLLRTLQTQVTELQSQQGPARGPAQPEIPEKAGSSS
ncbi:hypothetical protein Tco_0366364 [Tanacetum coccineum]